MSDDSGDLNFRLLELEKGIKHGSDNLNQSMGGLNTTIGSMVNDLRHLSSSAGDLSGSADQANEVLKDLVKVVGEANTASTKLTEQAHSLQKTSIWIAVLALLIASGHLVVGILSL